MNYKKDIKNLCLKSPSEEVCGLICFDENLNLKNIPLTNRHKNKKAHFSVDESEYIKCILSYDVIMCFHSHPCGTANPSKHDKKVSEELGLPFLIYSIEKDSFYLHIPDSFKPKSLVGRMYVESLYQCNNIVEDYFLLYDKSYKRGMIKNYCFERDDKFLLKIMNKNFYKVNGIEDVQVKDVFLFNFPTQPCCHMGIYIGNGEFLHQPENALSKSEILDHKWQKRMCNIYRLKS